MRVEAVGRGAGAPMPAVVEQLWQGRSAVQVSSVEGDASGWQRRTTGVALMENLVLTRTTFASRAVRHQPLAADLLPAAIGDADLLARWLEDPTALAEGLSEMLGGVNGEDAVAGAGQLRMLLLAVAYWTQDAGQVPEPYRVPAAPGGTGLRLGGLVNFAS